MKIAFVFGKALPYRISFFLKLSRFFDVDLFLESVETTNVLEANLCYECYRTFNVPFLSKYGSYMRCMHACGPQTKGKTKPVHSDIVDVAPTVLHIMEEEMPEHIEGHPR